MAELSVLPLACSMWLERNTSETIRDHNLLPTAGHILLKK